MEHLTTDKVSLEVLNILKIAQEHIEAFVPGRMPVTATIALNARHASDLADEPKEQLSRACRGSCLEIGLGI